MKVVKKYKDNIPKAVLHCFTGTQKELDDYLNMGFYIGLTGWICDERRNVDLRKSLINIPVEKLMIETDCPYLIPRNLDDKPKNNRNEPAYLPHIAKEIASLVNIDVNKFVEVTYTNSINFFK
jgi:TatD DNase family protein